MQAIITKVQSSEFEVQMMCRRCRLHIYYWIALAPARKDTWRGRFGMGTKKQGAMRPRFFYVSKQIILR